MPIATDITLDERTHTYTDADGAEYTSVSKIIGRYKEPFDRDRLALQTAQKRGVTVESVLAEWDTAAPYGTAVHKQIENYFTGKGDQFDLIQPHLWRFEQWKKQPVTFYPEVILCDRQLKIAGTADMLVRRGDTWSILDWKTNKAIYKTSFGGKKLKAPLSHLDDCNYIHYSLQLSLYAVMLGERVKKMNIIHLPKGKSDLEIIPCRDLWMEANGIMGDIAQEMDVLPF